MTWIRTQPALDELVRSLETCRAIGLDTESDSLYHYRDKVCLVQLATDRGEAFLVDSLAVDLRPLAPALASPRLVKVLHGADYDVATLKRDYGFELAGLFDTMLAARFLGKLELGLVAVARDELGVTLTKTNQKDDWSRRPLTPQQEAYALADVVHLVALRERLAERLAAVSRIAWLEEECEALAASKPLTRERDPEAWLEIKGARRLPPRSLAALRELHAWRERRAEATDTASFRILGSEGLLKLALRLPRSESELREVPGVLPRLARQAGEILAAVGRALAAEDAELPRPATKPRPAPPSEATLRRIERLKAWRARKGQELGLDPSVVLPQRLIERLVEAAPADAAGLARVDGLRRWRASTFGSELLAAVS